MLFFTGFTRDSGTVARQHIGNISKKTEELDAKVIEEVREFYSETYNFCYQNFPQTKHLWKK